jgi:hypothetical protein
MEATGSELHKVELLNFGAPQVHQLDSGPDSMNADRSDAEARQ